eukprot:654085_1
MTLDPGPIYRIEENMTSCVEADEKESEMNDDDAQQEHENAAVQGHENKEEKCNELERIQNVKNETQEKTKQCNEKESEQSPPFTQMAKQMEPKPYALQVEALEQINGDLRQAKDKLQHIIGDLRHENERLKSKAQKASIDHMEAIKTLDSFTQSLQAENKRLEAENSKMNEECKETKLELI